MQGAWTPWAPDAEKTRLVGAHFCGGPLGTFLVLITGGKLISSFGWETIFYCSAGQSSNLIYYLLSSADNQKYLGNELGKA